jgi:hypothetical protein
MTSDIDPPDIDTIIDPEDRPEAQDDKQVPGPLEQPREPLDIDPDD